MANRDAAELAYVCCHWRAKASTDASDYWKERADAAFDQLWKNEVLPLAKSVLFNLANNTYLDHDDLLQELYLHLRRQLPAYRCDRGAGFRTWCGQVLKRKARDLVAGKHRLRTAASKDGELEDTASPCWTSARTAQNGLSAVLEQEQWQRLADFCVAHVAEAKTARESRLRGQQVRCLELLLYSGCTQRGAAAQLGVHPGQVTRYVQAFLAEWQAYQSLTDAA